MIKRNFTTIHHLFAFALAMWIGLVIIRGVELLSIIQPDTLGLAFKIFVAGFWNDLGVIIICTLFLAVVSFCLSFLDKKVNVIAGGVSGIVIVFFTALLSFYMLDYKSFEELYGMSLSSSIASVFSNAFSGASLGPRLLILFFALGAFSLTYIFARGIRNGRMILFCIVIFVIQAISPQINKIKNTDYNQSYLVQNKLVSYVDPNASLNTNFSKELAVEIKDNINRAGLLEGIEDGISNWSKEEEAPLYEHLDQSEIEFMNDAGLVGKDESSLFNEAKNLAHSGKYDNASIVIKHLKSINPSNADYVYFDGLIHAWQNQFAEAEKRCLQALELAPNYQDIYISLADIHYWNGDIKAAIHILETGIAKLDNPGRLYAKKSKLSYLQ